MAEDIVMPRLSDSMEEGTILKWMKSVGDEVAVGDELAEIETDKANMVYEADAAGTLIEILAGEGDTLPIGEVIARVGEEGEEPTGNGASAPKEAGRPRARAGAEEPEPEPEDPADTPAPEPSGDGRVKASPIARRIAKEKGIEIGSLSGSGPSGRIVKADVEKAVESGGAPAAESEAARPPRRPNPPQGPAKSRRPPGARSR